VADISHTITTVPLVNSQTNTVESLPQDKVGPALNSGTHNLPGGTTLNVLDPDGKLVSLPAEQVPDAINNAGYSIPGQEHITEHNLQKTYGEGIGNEAKTFGSAAANAATLGAFNQAGVRSGLLSPEAQRERAARNPVSEMAGSAAGVIGAMAIPGIGEADAVAEATAAAKAAGLSTEGIANAGKMAAESFRPGDLLNPAQGIAKIGQAVTDGTAGAITQSLANPESSSIVSKILAKATGVGSKTLGSAVEGAVYGAGQSISEQVLGDPNYNAENLLHNVGYGALFGGGLGAFLGITGEGYGALKGQFGSKIEQAAIKDAIIENTASATTALPASLNEMAERLNSARGLGLSTELPSKALINEGNSILAGDSEFPVTTIQEQSLNSDSARTAYKASLDNPSSEGGQLHRQWEAAQKYEGVNKLIPQYIQEIAPGYQATGDSMEGGTRLIKAFTKQDAQESAEMKPLFKEFDDRASTLNAKPEEILTRLNDAVPNASKYIEQSFDPESLYRGEHRFGIKPFDGTLGVSKPAYESLKSVVEALNKKEGLTLSSIRNLRNVLGQDVNFFTHPVAAMEVSAIKRSLMDMMQDGIQRALKEMTPEQLEQSAFKNSDAVRDLMKRYAIKQENKGTMEQLFGGSINQHATYKDSIAPEKVLDRIFRDTTTVNAAKEILGPQEWNKVTANYLKSQVEKVTDRTTNNFSSKKFSNFLNAKKEYALDEALSQNPEQLNKLRAISNRLSILPDSVSPNPSGTAKMSLYHKMQNLVGFVTGDGVAAVPSKLWKAAADHLDAARERSSFDRILKGGNSPGSEEQLTKKTRQYGVFAKVERMQQATASTIDRGMNALLKGGEALKGITAQKLIPHEENLKNYDKLEAHLTDMTANPNKLIDSLADSTHTLNDIAPDINTHLNINAVRATQFLASKLPVQNPSSPLTPAYKPSKSELSKFNRYARIVENPLHVIEQLKQGSLTTESLETLQTVYPQLLKQMQTALTGKLNEKTVAKMPYQSKIMASAFLGQDLTNSLSQSSVLSAQIQSAPQQTSGPTAPRPKDKVGPSQKGLGKLDSSTHFMTPMQQSLARTER